MAPIEVDLNDYRAWDDNALVNSWEGALAEYKRYHSIHLEGKKVEDVLTEEELKELRMELGHDLDMDVDSQIDERNAVPKPKANKKGRSNGKENALPGETVGTDREDGPTTSGQQQPQESGDSAIPHSTSIPASMPQAILANVQDDNLRNAMMAWYYAGYYTGLHEGQQKAAAAGQDKS